MTAPRREPLAKEPLDLSQFEGHTPEPWAWCDAWTSPDGKQNAARLRGDNSEDVARANDGGDIKITTVDGELLASAPRLLSELLEARERIEKQDEQIAALREYVDYFDRASRGAVLMANAHGYRFPMDLYDEGVSLRKRIGRNEDGTWCEPKAKDAKEGA